MIIYKVTCLVNNKIYIGQTTKSLNVRKTGHWNDLKRRNKTKTRFQRALLKYGQDNFIWEILDESAKTLEELNQKEIDYIKLYNSINKNKGYNSDFGGKNSVRPKELGLKVSKKLKENYANGYLPPLKDKHHTKETIENMINIKKTIPVWNKGKHLSKETCEKIRIAMTGNRNPFYGKKHDEQTMEKIRQTKKINHQNNLKLGIQSRHGKSIMCVETGKIYPTIQECARDMKLSYTTLVRFRKQNKPYHGYTFKDIKHKETMLTP